MSLLRYTTLVAAAIFALFCYHQGRGASANLAEAVKPAAQRSYTPPPLPPGVVRLHGTRPVFIGPQLTADQLDAFLHDYAIEHVVDLAAEAAAEQILTTEAERAICEDYTLFPVHYLPLNIEGRGGKLNEAALVLIDSLVDTYKPVFIHCRHGQHRAKVPAARALARDGYHWPGIVDLLHWHDVVRTSRYDRYTNNARIYAEQFHHPVTLTK